MLSLQEISDRMEILDVLADYSDAVDNHNWGLLDRVFTSDAILDFSAREKWKGDREGFKQWLSPIMAASGTYYHMTATTKFESTATRRRVENSLFRPQCSGRRGGLCEPALVQRHLVANTRRLADHPPIP